MILFISGIFTVAGVIFGIEAYKLHKQHKVEFPDGWEEEFKQQYWKREGLRCSSEQLPCPS
jgi:hypothetical protein